MRSGGAPLHADETDDIAALRRLPHRNLQRALVDIDGEDAMAVIENCGAAGEIEIGSANHRAVGRRVDRGSFWRCDVNSEMRRLGTPFRMR